MSLSAMWEGQEERQSKCFQGERSGKSWEEAACCTWVDPCCLKAHCYSLQAEPSHSSLRNSYTHRDSARDETEKHQGGAFVAEHILLGKSPIGFSEDENCLESRESQQWSKSQDAGKRPHTSQAGKALFSSNLWKNWLTKWEPHLKKDDIKLFK